ncbi:hypothetical protein SLS60_011892 [Paraconiothyrium brasiliense]|uniref:DUF7730 domain-containing protein n=1 Tax=Paraconiothyrium brasiliense TaxID=300254 RepID=A0ABR3QH60_9PLEO
MASKRTYSRHNMSIAQSELSPSDPDNIYHETNKRRKPTPPSSADAMPPSNVLNGGGRPRGMKQEKSSGKLQKVNSKKRFSGPTTLPGNEVEHNDSEQKTDPFESVLAHARAKQVPQQPRSSIYGGGRAMLNSFSAQLKSRKRAEKKMEGPAHAGDDSSVDGGIQLAPNGESEVASLGSDDIDITMEGSDAVNVTMRGGSALTAAEASARIFDGREYTAPQTAPPRKTLWGDRMRADSAEAQAWSANQSNSPLLRLPSNVRRSIFEYALGGNSIEFGYVTYLVETLPDGKQRSVPYFQYTSNVYDDRHNPFQGSRVLLHDDPDFLGMTLLNGICRQLYFETYTLPYSLNDFYITSSNALFNFLVQEDRLQPQQCKAIKSLVILHELPVPAVLEKLPNLQHVRLMDSYIPMAGGYYKVRRVVWGDLTTHQSQKVTPELVKYQPTSKLTKPTIRGGHGYDKFTHPYARRLLGS